MLRDAEAEGGFGFERLFSGFLVTCGLDHIRQPARGKPLHGHLPFTPGRLTAHGEDWNAATPVLFCEGEVTQARQNGERLRLLRRIEAPIGGSSLRIIDRVQNIGGREEEIFLLYHTNLGFPLIAPGSVVSLGEEVLLGPISRDSSHGEPSVRCLPVPASDPVCTVRRPGDGRWRGFEALVRWDASTLPYLQIWNDPRPNNQIVAIEPVSTDRHPDGTSHAGERLPPGGTRTYRVEYSFGDLDGPGL